MDVRLANEQHIEVHKFHAGVVTGSVILALVLEAFLPVHLRWAELVDLPLLVTIYFALSRRNPSAGLVLGMIIGVAQDSLSHTPIGLYGIAKTIVGFTASSIGARLDVEHPVARCLLTFAFFQLHNAVFVFISRLLLARPEPYLETRVMAASVVGSLLTIALFPLLDRLRKPS
jgi:rod shape-determining protein MreD